MVTERPVLRLATRGSPLALWQAERVAALLERVGVSTVQELAAPGLVLAAFPERVDTRDVLVGGELDQLSTGATVATGSARRRVQLANYRPDLTFAGLRGNLATRLAAAGTGSVAAAVVAKAAIDRLGWTPPDGVVVEVLRSSETV